jgi:transposase-like protein
MLIEQTSLIKYFPFLEKSIIRKPRNKNNKSNTEFPFSIEIGHDSIVKIKETHCLDCGSRLIKNGCNKRVIIRDNGKGKLQFLIQRKRCPQCGEIHPDYSELFPKFGNYHENYKRRALQHYMEGLMPSQIRRVFKIDFGITISKTSIVNWINEVAEPLRDILQETPIPSSGHWGYDEIHMRIKGQRMYTLDTVDVVTKFIPGAKISESMGRKAGYHLFKEARRHNTLWIKSLIKDCTTNLGGLLRTHSFKHIIQQNCLTHVKWMISKHIKAFCGLSTQSKKPIPAQWYWLLKRFYNVIDSSNETNAYIAFEIVRQTIDRLKGKKIRHLHTVLKNLKGWFPKIIAHQRNLSIPKTNNLLEAFHKKYIYYPSFKRAMMTIKGAQRVLDYRVFRHNFGRFPSYIQFYCNKYKRYQLILQESGNDPSIRGQGHHFTSIVKKLNRWFGNYNKVWSQYFAII